MISIDVKFFSNNPCLNPIFSCGWVMTVLNDKDIIDFFMFDTKPTKRQIRLCKKEAMIRWNKFIQLM